MADERFDPVRAVRFDLNHGVVRLKDSVEHMLVPVDALAGLWRGAGAEAAREFGQRLGTEAARRALASLSGDIGEATPERVLEHLGGQLALLGMGSLGLERWGRCLVLVVEHSPLGDDSESVLAAVLEAALQRTTSRDVRVLALGRQAERQRLLVVSPAAAEKVRAWLSEGQGAETVLARLNSGVAGGAA